MLAKEDWSDCQPFKKLRHYHFERYANDFPFHPIKATKWLVIVSKKIMNAKSVEEIMHDYQD